MSTTRGPSVAAPARPGPVPAPARALLLTGLGAVILGGVVAAATGPLDLAHGSWLAAYLVLVVGVAQVAMGQDRAFAARPAGAGWAQWAGWNGGCALVVLGTLIGRPWLVDAGAVLLLGGLLVAIAAHRSAPPAPDRTPRGWAAGYLAVLVVLAASMPIGVLLSHLRH